MVVVPVRPTTELELPAAVVDEPRVDLLEPLAALYGARRPGVFVAAEVAADVLGA